jgi:uncharacterized membrane protein YgcG
MCKHGVVSNRGSSSCTIGKPFTFHFLTFHFSLFDISLFNVSPSTFLSPSFTDCFSASVYYLFQAFSTLLLLIIVIKMMRRFPLALLCMLMFGACSSSKKNESSNSESLPEEGAHQLAIAVNVDGDLSEWPSPLPGYSKETSLHFGVTNNNDYLFIAVACADQQMQRKMLRAGMEIYISDFGKKETVTGIEFPMPAGRVNAPPQTTDDGNGAAERPGNFKTAALASETELRTFGLKKTPDRTYPINGSNFKVATAWANNDFLNIEYAIPLKELYTGANSSSNKSIQVGFKLNGFKHDENSRSANGSNAGGGMYGGGMRGGGMRGGGIRGGGMRGGMRGGRMYPGSNSAAEMMSKDQSFWTKYTVSSAGK